MSDSNGVGKEIWGCLGAVLAAIITGVFSLIIAGKLPFPNSSPLPTITTTPVSTIIVVQQPTSYIVIENKLFLPAKIWIDGVYRGDVDSSGTGEFSITSYPVKVDFEVHKQNRDDGLTIGNDFRGMWSNIGKEERLTIRNIVGEQYYFAPSVHNKLPVDCDIYVNAGYPTEFYVGMVRSGNDAFAGYYYWYSDSNVTLYCGNERKVYFWGIHPSYTETTLLNVAADSGVLELTVGP